MRRIIRRSLRQRTEGFAQTVLHLLRIEIANYAKDDVVGSKVALMPIEQILPRDRCDGPILCLATIGTVFSIAELGCLTSCNAVDLVLTARDGGRKTARGERDLLLAKHRVLEHVKKIGKHLIEILFQTVEACGCCIDASAGFNSRANRLQLVIELISGFLLCPAGAPTGRINRHHPRLRRRLCTGSALDQSGPADQRQLMIFLKKDNHPVRQLNARRFLRLELRQGRNRDLLPGLLREGDAADGDGEANRYQALCC